MTDYFKIIRYIVYSIEIVIFFAIQRVPESLMYFFTGTRPLYLIPLAFTVTVLEGKKPGFIFSIIAGVLIDLDSSFNLGFYTVILPVVSLFLNDILEKIINVNFFSATVLIFSFILVISILEILFLYITKFQKDNLLELTNLYFPRSFFTFLTIPVFYLFNRAICLILKKSSKVKDERT